MKLSIVFCAIYFLFISLNIGAQSSDDMRKLYMQGQYAEVLPSLEKAVKLSPKNALYNLWYGNSLLETGNPEQARAYLTFAASKKITNAYQALGKMHYLLYEFERSAKAYSEYRKLLEQEKKQAEADKILPLIQCSERAARMLSHCEDIQIIDSLVVDKQSFLDAYFLSNESGRLEKKGDTVVYENPLRNKRYYAEKTEEGVYRIFSEIKLQTEWGDNKKLELSSDASENQNYPFVLQDGLTIYYASTGSNSIGGYDLFITRYNTSNSTCLTPSQLGMPFNSVGNDYMMAIDEINRIGFFATDRFQPEGKVIVYTFIPNEDIITLNADDEKQLISRAKIVSIHDTWKPSENYSEYLTRIKDSREKEESKTANDFFFVIDDNTVYHTYDNFKSETARQAFMKLTELKESIQQLETELERLRSEYALANDMRKGELRPDILSKEGQLYDLSVQSDQTVRDVRNQEIKQLKQL
ncbi:MAG: tetratricopeptide repeat protein [Candidatus Azobacteroides sp.]|nr:tetratricopeptide repeat protein [Candidatus Azobacteroides sp.]